MAEDALTYLRNLKKSLEDLPDETYVQNVANAVSKKILNEIKRYS